MKFVLSLLFFAGLALGVWLALPGPAPATAAATVSWELADIREHEQVAILDIDNGARFETYAIVGEPGEVCLNGAAARLVAPGDRVIVITYGDYEDAELDGFEPTVVHVDTANRPVLAERIYQGMKAAWEATKRVPLQTATFRAALCRLEPRDGGAFSVARMRQRLTEATRPFDQCLAALGLAPPLNEAGVTAIGDAVVTNER